jgi:hypothetical protein
MAVSAETLLGVSVVGIAVIIIVVAALNYLSWKSSKKKPKEI